MSGRWTVEPLRLPFLRPFRTARGTRDGVVNVRVRWEVGGRTGEGEAHPSPRFGESLDGLIGALQTLTPPDPRPRIEDWLATVDRDHPALTPAARAALVAAGCDLHARREGVSLSELWRSKPLPLPPSSMTLSIDTPERVASAAAAAEAAGFPRLKMKVGLAGDRERVAAVRRVCALPLRVDANEGWRSRERAVRALEWLAGNDIELLEQPFPAGRHDDVAWLRARTPIPLFADEDAVGRDPLDGVRGVYDGVNLKLEKNGGLDACRAAAVAARAAGIRTLLGCFPGSSLAMAGAVAIAPDFDAIDLDAPLFLRADPYDGLRYAAGVPQVRSVPGNGVSAR